MPRPAFTLLPILAVTSVFARPVFDTLAHAPGPRPTVEQVLNNAIPGRPAIPPVAEEHDATGYARERLYRVPAPGEHPRILFSAADLPRIREQLASNPTGRRLRDDAARRADPGPADQWLARAHAALVAADVGSFQAVWEDPKNPHQAAPPGALGSPLTSLIFYRGLTALLDEDAARGRETATAVATYAAWLGPRIDAAARKPGAENYWLQVRGAVGDFGGLGFLYDFTHPYATAAQRETVRGVIAGILGDRYGLGMDLPPHWRNWNFIGMGLYFPLLALSLEGEPGFDPRIVARGREVARDYILHGNSALGAGTEGVGYHTAGMGHLTLFAFALANRGDHLLTLTRYRRMLDTWLVWTLQPYGREWASNGDLGSFPPNASTLQAARFLFPDDPRIALVAGQAPEVTRLDRPVPEAGLVQLLAPAELGTDVAAGRAPAFPEEFPLSAVDAERGVLFARGDRGADAVALQFHARGDTTYPSHDHADRGAFFLTALGQAWTVPSFRETESKYLSTITIDGVGQGYFPTPARWVEVADTPAALTATVDLSYCYNWRWMKSSFLATDDQLAREPWLEWVREPRDRLLGRVPREKWERDPLPAVRRYNEAWLAGDPRMWGAEDAWVLRSAYNPVEKAFRSIAFVRGPAPFVVIADDIRKDAAERLYEWRMILPLGVEAHDIKARDILLGPVAAEHSPVPAGQTSYKNAGKPVATKGAPRLLVRVLEMARPALPEAAPALAVETIEFVKDDDVHQFAGRSTGLGRRVVLPSRSVEPRYRVLLFPHRFGDALPVTRWESPELLSVVFGGTETRVRFAPHADGSTRLSVVP